VRAVLVGALLAVGAVLAGCGSRDVPVPRPALAVVQRPEVLRVDVSQGPWSDQTATGFVLGPRRVLTVAHVLGVHGTGARLRLRSPSGVSAAVAARVLSIDQRNDLAVLAVTGLRGATAGAEPAHGRAVVLVIRGGAVRALPARLRRSILATIRTPDGRRTVDRPALELGADIRPGDSGAPVVGGDGRVLGVVFAQADRTSGVAYAVDARVLTGR
jgi:S1-C subfamily serine protease